MILVIDNYDSFTYNLYQSVAQFYRETLVVRNDKITLSEIKALNPQGIILSPGPGRPESAGICISLISALIKGDLNFKTPVLGVCLGHQAITVALGGDVIQANEIFHGKDDLIFHQRKGLYQTLPLPFTAGRYHSLIADRKTLPKTLAVDAENSNGLIMGIQHVKLPIYGVQFHPESILTPCGNNLLRAFVQRCQRSGEC
jgi:anthranilate synthase component 2